jgi:hypothetical protein
MAGLCQESVRLLANHAPQNSVSLNLVRVNKA